MTSLLAVRRALSEELKSDSKFLFINTRLILRTGIDLSRVEESASEPERVALVTQALREMGYLREVGNE